MPDKNNLSWERGLTIDLKNTRDPIEAVNAALSQSKFDDVNLSNSRFSNVNLTNARLENVNMTGVAIDNVNLTDMTIRGVKVMDLFAAYENAKA